MPDDPSGGADLAQQASEDGRILAAVDGRRHAPHPMRSGRESHAGVVLSLDTGACAGGLGQQGEALEGSRDTVSGGLGLHLMSVVRPPTVIVPPMLPPLATRDPPRCMPWFFWWRATSRSLPFSAWPLPMY